MEAKADRIEGPTPSGGAYALLYRDAEGVPVEVVELDSDDREIMRTYVGPRDGADS